ncbi:MULTISPECIES: envelope stress sensor histidine kinase BaeS [Photorhabdus]|uniref:histidine kinase n=2 Tax=Photorhabdus asymbiotica TaxID=291112 RepID=C7BTK2_PHOAA|nr:two-component system sensor histidine kinase BaeS [Photorhabdus asymbiotica]RKS66241.1 two-component system sensor histidine kinase BaeS [Photorhabdus asymbiotica]CAQ83857.1 sensory histidine kinase protein [Photorhabdus asymbiotica]
MKLSISSKLFMAIFATCMLVLITMHWGVRSSFQRGFIGYIKQNIQLRTSMLAEALAEQYQQYGSWKFLKKNNRIIFQIIRSIEQTSESHQGPPPRGWRTQFWVVDRDMKLLVGHEGEIPPDTYREPINYNNQIVGWVIVSTSDKITRQADISFDRQQQLTSWIIAGLSTLLAIIATLLLSRGMLKPVKRLVEGTHKLAAGDFSVRVTPSSKDEIGQLAYNFNQLASTLEKNEQMRRDYMADISHELRTPLSVLRGELEALQDGVRKPTSETLNSLLAEITTLTKLVDDLHQLSLSDRGALAYRKGFINISELLQVAIASYRGRFIDKQIQVDVKLPEIVMLFADPDRLTQLFHNLLENSLRYTAKNGKLMIEGNSDDSHFILNWQDSEPGLLPEQCQRVFERFYRSESSRNRASGGSGLGLAICYNITEAHNGTIHAEPSPLGGLRINIELPLIKSPDCETL